jgi:LPS export ABC transporter protein LptC
VRRKLEIAVLVCGALFLAVLAVSFRPGGRPEQRPGRGTPEGDADGAGQPTTLLDGFDFTESVGGKPLLRIKADRTVGYGPSAGLAPNLYAGEKVTLTVYPDDGQPVTVLADRADYDERTRESKLHGNVRWTDSDGGLAETDTVLFHPSKRTLEAPRPVHFTRGTVDLSAPSATYDLAEKVVRFRGPVSGASGGAETGGLTNLTAREALYRREPGILELEQVVAGSRGGDRLESDHLILKMADAGHHPEWARATGSVRGSLLPGGVGDSATPAHGHRRYEGDDSTTTFDESGKARSVTLRGAPARLADDDRRVAASTITVALTEGRASEAQAAGSVVLESQGRTARSDRGRLSFAEDGSAQNVVLDGSVRIDEDGRTATATKAVQLEASDVWLLTGAPDASAHVESGGSKLSADRIEVDRPRQQIRGDGNARAVFAPDPKDQRPAPVSFVGDRKKPTFGKADRVVLDDAAKVATLTGKASLWQDDSSLFADSITLSDAEKSVLAVQNVRAVLAPSQKDAKQARSAGRAAEARGASVVTSRRMRYRDTDHSARFENGVAVTRGGWSATGGDATAWLDDQGEVVSTEISGDVKMTDRTVGRTGEAEKALDYPKEGKTVLWGSPARVTDSGGNRVAGAVLTIVDHGRTVQITAPEGGKTETVHRTRAD